MNPLTAHLEAGSGSGRIHNHPRLVRTPSLLFGFLFLAAALPAATIIYDFTKD
jgi:hypothetical protein